MTHNLLTTVTLTFGVPSRPMYVSIAKSTSLTKAQFENSGKTIEKICVCKVKNADVNCCDLKRLLLVGCF